MTNNFWPHYFINCLSVLARQNRTPECCSLTSNPPILITYVTSMIEKKVFEILDHILNTKKGRGLVHFLYINARQKLPELVQRPQKPLT